MNPSMKLDFGSRGGLRSPHRLQCGPLSDGISVSNKLRISWTVSDSYWAWKRKTLQSAVFSFSTLGFFS